MRLVRAIVNLVIAVPLVFSAVILVGQPRSVGGARTPPAPVSDTAPEAPQVPQRPPTDDGGSGAVPVHPLSAWPPPFSLRAGTWLIHTPPGAGGSGIAGGSQEYLLCIPKAGEWTLMDADEGLPFASMVRAGLGGLTRDEFGLLVGGQDRIAEWGAYARRPW
jgi:hypothetical protein